MVPVGIVKRSLLLFGIVLAAIGAVANATKLQALMDALVAVDLDAVDVNAAAVGFVVLHPQEVSFALLRR